MTNTPITELAKTFDPAAIEAKWYPHWEQTGQFRPARPDAQPFTIVNPPPNVTGSLHIGHALDNTLQDIVIRYERLRGKDALWVVGTDHAGIATQMVVERQMNAKGEKRTDYTRDGFVEKVWEWKHESGGTITGQLRRLGCSMDWSREQFTMDPHFTRAVVKVFVDLYNQGLLYRDKRLVNWDPGLKTAISDLEVETREVKGGFWHFKYPLADSVLLDGPGVEGQDYIEVATTRPETMLADMAVAVNPQDARYASVIGKHVILPITGRRIPIVADDHADPELGSGAVKITPGHDFNDFEVGKRAGIAPAQMLNMLDAHANVVQTADGLVPADFIGLERFEARKLVVEQLKALGLLIPHVTRDKEGNETEHDAEPRTIQTPYGDRSGVVIEPWLTDQWYVDAATLAKPAIEAVRSGAIEIVPKSWEKTYFNWMENIQPWCVSRQLWWGHRIPAWFDEDGNVFVAETEEEAQTKAGNRKLTRDEDVLDTWFSSALWPFATLGWPEEQNHPSLSREGTGVGVAQRSDAAPSPTPTPPLKGRGLVERHYPNDLLISGFDILFFWDARMAMQGIHFMKDVPWKRLYLHGLVRAADGQKMSKSKGNVVDPLGLIDQYGADALRFFMAAMESQGRDVKMDEKRVEGYRNFATKLWNAVRFAQSNGIGASESVAAPAATLAVNKWIIGEVVSTVAELDKALADLRFDAAANAIYHFVWDQFCDWYLELVKPILSSKPSPLQGGGLGGGPQDGLSVPPLSPTLSPEGEREIKETKAVAGWVIDQILVMLHPFMPFITEELWHAQGARPYDLIVAQWPAPAAQVDAQASAEIDWLIRMVSEIRTARAELGVPPGAKLTAIVNEANPQTRGRVERLTPALSRLARIETWQFDGEASGGAAQVVVDEATVVLPLEGVIDIEAERARLTKSLHAAQKEAKSLEGRLANPAFVEKAKPEAVEKARADHAEKVAEFQRLEAALTRLG
ncbi:MULTISPECIES: valine--tRNA ligase [Sphingobium]|uniref:valine--tRNA ligase n=1 Tax=Sphingobium TaxID=165695 RepID=UPI0015EC3238|nr:MULTISPECIES: valine--tRNA ligase [Sphingobium]MCW2362626.1 valyl-tRNA synthetase [Sphingobium sp. B10D3B]MCW2400694.1 valyl-tRNA synthetase [Sphingobium sp. B10D7B]MCW2407673.1 valyl-tRNA synthetase [Sphingobium xanthum]